MNNLPMAVLTKVQMIAVVTHWVELIKKLLSSEAAHVFLRRDIHERITAGTIEMMTVVEAAENGHADADIALRQLATRMIDVGAEMPVVLANFVQRALMRPVFTSYPLKGGQNFEDVWVRNIGIAILVDVACKAWGLHYSRNRSPAAGEIKPAGSSLVAAALKRHRIALSAAQIERIYRDHKQLAERLQESLGRKFHL